MSCPKFLSFSLSHHLLTDQDLWQAKKEAIKFLEEKILVCRLPLCWVLCWFWRKWKNEIWSAREYVHVWLCRNVNYCSFSRVFSWNLDRTNYRRSSYCETVAADRQFGRGTVSNRVAVLLKTVVTNEFFKKKIVKYSLVAWLAYNVFTKRTQDWWIIAHDHSKINDWPAILIRMRAADFEDFFSFSKWIALVIAMWNILYWLHALDI